LLHIWDIVAGTEERDGAGGRPVAATFNRNGTQLAYSAFRNGRLEFLLGDPTKWDKAKSVEKPLPGVFLFTPDGRNLLAMTQNFGIRMFDSHSGNPVRWVRKVEEAPMVYEEGAFSRNATPAVSPDGKTIALPGKQGAFHLVEVATGKDRQTLNGKQGAIACLAFSPNGLQLVSGSEDGTTVIWNLRAKAGEQKTPLTEKDLQTVWDDLGGDNAAKGYLAIQKLAAAPAQAAAFFRKQLPPAGAVEQKRIEQFIADLKSEDGAVRKKSETELAKIGILARPSLLKALAEKPSLDMSQRINKLLKGLEDRTLSANEIRILRAVEAVELSHSSEAKKLLRDWARGASGALLTEEARASLSRLPASRR
jgi:WD40 repeat protein